jgi:hypothetical protein
MSVSVELFTRKRGMLTRRLEEEEERSELELKEEDEPDGSGRIVEMALLRESIVKTELLLV